MSERFYGTFKHPAWLFSVWPNTMCCKKRESKNRERSGSSIHLGCQHTLFLPRYQLLCQAVETCRHCIMRYQRDGTEPCANQWPRWARMISQTLFDASTPLLLSVLLLYRAATWTCTHFSFPGSFSVPRLDANSQAHLPPVWSAPCHLFFPYACLSRDCRPPQLLRRVFCSTQGSNITLGTILH